MTWKPISYHEIQELIQAAIPNMSGSQKKFWQLICIPPEKWQQVPLMMEAEKFWVVAVCGKRVVFYDDVEEGFIIGDYTEYGAIIRSDFSQDELQHSLNKLIGEQTS